MRWTTLVRASLVAAALATFSATVTPPVLAAYRPLSLEVDVGVFYDDLAPHGRWIETGDYGWVFAPSVSRSWRPYTVGHWVWTDEYGWLWVSDEPFGWATYHYGRWYDDPVLGWAWVPGYDWAPAWVSFRSGGGYVGWAPLPPRLTWAGGSFRVGAIQLDAYIEPRHYCFVPERSFVDRAIRSDVVSVSRNVTIINVTQNVTNYAVANDRIVNRSVDVERVERAVGRRVPRLRAVGASSVGEARRERVRGNQVEVFNPVVRRASVERKPARGKTLQQRQAERPREEAQRRDQARQREAGRQAELRAQEKLRGQDAARERLQAQVQERSRRAQEAAQRQAAALQRQAERRRQGREARSDERDHQQIERRQAQDRRELERAHDRGIRQPQRNASAAEAERRREAEHRALEQRQRQERQDFDASREGARQAREGGGRDRQARLAGQQRREPGAPEGGRQPRQQKPQQQLKDAKTQHKSEKQSPRR